MDRYYTCNWESEISKVNLYMMNVASFVIATNMVYCWWVNHLYFSELIAATSPAHMPNFASRSPTPWLPTRHTARCTRHHHSSHYLKYPRSRFCMALHTWQSCRSNLLGAYYSREHSISSGFQAPAVGYCEGEERGNWVKSWGTACDIYLPSCSPSACVYVDGWLQLFNSILHPFLLQVPRRSPVASSSSISSYRSSSMIPCTSSERFKD
jgi:hypothetical protein